MTTITMAGNSVSEKVQGIMDGIAARRSKADARFEQAKDRLPESVALAKPTPELEVTPSTGNLSAEAKHAAHGVKELLAKLGLGKQETSIPAMSQKFEVADTRIAVLKASPINQAADEMARSA